MELYKDPKYSPEERADDLLKHMTLTEKIGQLSQKLFGFNCYIRNGDNITVSEEFCNHVKQYGGIGALYGLHRADPWSQKNFETGLTDVLAIKTRNLMQKYVIEHSRLGIPLSFTNECPHGHQALDGYLLPVSLAMVASFNPELVEEAFKICGEQMKNTGVDLAFIGGMDILRDPRWGRCEECYGEDPFLASKMATSVIKGMISSGTDVLTKHFIAQGQTVGGINHSAANIGPRELREIHLPSVKACVDAGASAVMAAYNEVDGVYCSGSNELINGLLRNECGFDGFVVSDAGSVELLDRITGDNTKSCAISINAGLDMTLLDNSFDNLEEAINLGYTDIETVDNAVRRILIYKFKRGLFENPYVPEEDVILEFNTKKYPQGLKLAEQCPVLLKNNGILPLDGSKKFSMAVTGPNSDNIYNQTGDYTPPLKPEKCTTFLKGLNNYISSNECNIKVVTAPYNDMFSLDRSVIDNIIDSVKDTELVFAVVGGSSNRFKAEKINRRGAVEVNENTMMDCGEGVDCGSLKLPGLQIELLERLKKAGHTVVTIVIAGRPYEMSDIDRFSDAVIYSFYPGPFGGDVLTKISFGDISPSGRLPVSLPDTVAQLPVYYNYKQSYPAMTYYDIQPPKYTFGCGITYTNFEYQLVNAPTCQNLTVEFKVKNTGNKAAYAVPQLYLHRTQGLVIPRIRELCGFNKIYLKPNEEETVSVTIPKESLMQWDLEMKQRLVSGDIEWFVCDSGIEFLKGNFYFA